MNARRWILLGAGALYFLSLVFPAILAGTGPDLQRYDVIHGYAALLLGPFALLNLSNTPEWLICWLANPFALVALYAIINKTPTRMTAAASFFPFLLSLVSLTITSTMVSDHPVPAVISHGAYLWMASFLILGVAGLLPLIKPEHLPTQ